MQNTRVTVDDTMMVSAIERDVRQAKSDGVVGMPIDGQEWDRLLTHIAASSE